MRLSAARFFRVCDEHPWGDYGAILVHGWFDVDPEVLKIIRAGPHVPSVSLVSDYIVVDSATKRKLELASRNVRFQKVVKHHIVDLPWEQWPTDRLPDIVHECPEPEEILLSNPHSPSAAKAMGDLWAMKLAVGTRARFAKKAIEIESQSWTGYDVFAVEIYGGTFPIVTAAGRELLETAADTKWIGFEPLDEY